MQSKIWASLAMATLAGALAGCESTTKLSEAKTAVPVESREPGTAATLPPPASTSGTPQSRVATVDLAPSGAAGSALLAAPAQRVVYFDFDSFAIKDDFKPLVEGYAKVLAANHSKHMVIEGHTDERGGREYNLALGQKRAEAVVKSLELLGATETQLEAVSFGKERPAVQGDDEAAWARNRRAELKDR